MEWQPIETAKRDGTQILVFFRGKGCRLVSWENPWNGDIKDGIWCVDDDKHGPYPLRGYNTGDDTHWMPLPEPPKAANG